MLLRKLVASNVKELPIPFGSGSEGEILTISYCQDAYTVKLERQLQEQIKNNLPGQMLKVYILKLVKGWDVVDYHPDDMELPEEERRTVPVPLNEETLDDIIPIDKLARVVEAIAEDQRPNLTSSKNTEDS